MMRILFVEKDPELTQKLKGALQESCNAFDSVSSGQEALELLRLYKFDAVLCDLILPDSDGVKVIGKMRTRGDETPVIVLSALGPSRHASETKIKCFASGADDVVNKPFDNDELIARIGAVVRRSRGYAQAVVSFGTLEIDLHNRIAKVNGREVPFSTKEYQFLEFMALRKGAILNKEAFLDQLYGCADETARSAVDMLIHRVRARLREAGADNLIGTVRGSGYIMREPASYAPLTSPHPVGSVTASFAESSVDLTGRVEKRGRQPARGNHTLRNDKGTEHPFRS